MKNHNNYQMSTNKIIEVVLTLVKNNIISDDTARLLLYQYSEWLIEHAKQETGVKCPQCEQLVMPF